MCINKNVHLLNIKDPWREVANDGRNGANPHQKAT